MTAQKPSDVVQGTLEMLILRVLALEPGSLYPAFRRLGEL